MVKQAAHTGTCAEPTRSPCVLMVVCSLDLVSKILIAQDSKCRSLTALPTVGAPCEPTITALASVDAVKRKKQLTSCFRFRYIPCFKEPWQRTWPVRGRKLGSGLTEVLFSLVDRFQIARYFVGQGKGSTPPAHCASLERYVGLVEVAEVPFSTTLKAKNVKRALVSAVYSMHYCGPEMAWTRI